MIFLIGPRASGKTSLAMALSERKGYTACDLDQVFTEEEQCTIAEYVHTHGWDAFRAEEARILSSTIARYVGQKDVVIATGGGIVLSEENRAILTKSGLVVYLNAPWELLLRRLLNDPLAAQRPALTTKSFAEELRTTVLERMPLYRACADIELDASLDQEMLFGALLRAVENRRFQR